MTIRLAGLALPEPEIETSRMRSRKWVPQHATRDRLPLGDLSAALRNLERVQAERPRRPPGKAGR